MANTHLSALAMFVITIALTVSLLRAYFKRLVSYIRNRIQLRRYPENIPRGTFGLPLLGESLQFIASYRSHTSPDAFINERRSRYGRVFTTHLFGKPTVMSMDAEVNRFILNNDGRLFVPDYPSSIQQLMGKWTILMLEGSLHKRLHGLLATFFKSDDLKEHLLPYIEAFVQQQMDTWNVNTTIYVEEETKRMSFKLVAKVLLGLDPGQTVETLQAECHNYVAGAMSLPINLPGTTFHSSLRSRSRIAELTRQIMNDRETRARELGPCVQLKLHMDMLGALMEDRKAASAIKQQVEEPQPSNNIIDDMENEVGPFDCKRRMTGRRPRSKLAENSDAQNGSMTEEIITDNIVSFFFPSEDSVGMLMTLSVKYISESPRALQQLREENINFLEKYKGERLTWRHYFMELTFTQKVLNETLRLANITKGVIRKSLVDVHVKDFVIPKGWATFVFFRGVHLDEAIYEDAQIFNPWRWEEKVLSSHYTPFGGGPRLCAGIDISRLMAVVFLHHLVTRYEWEMSEVDSLTQFPFLKLAKKLPINILRAYNNDR
ncbi:hypothetical protein KP509_05G026200 [Ceratopteris richardii]|uniref:Cytochrome P450 n=1 Tax=Ceratopteris richardii TaxID=49495 RepID=A0A8T2UPQ0_CERRI|nr:hypothetical protein KP509_05G026200 [Ceratopteris richardii]